LDNQPNQSHDQAEQLKQLFNDLNQHEQQQINNKSDFLGNDDVQKIDILNLPPRKTIHDKKKNKFKIRLKRPFLRFLFVIICLIAIIITIVFFMER